MGTQVNKKADGDYGYIALYKGKKVEVWARSSYEAQRLAAQFFGAKASYRVFVHLCERPDGAAVVHVATD